MFGGGSGGDNDETPMGSWLYGPDVLKTARSLWSG